MFTSGTQALQGRTVNHDPKPFLDADTGERLEGSFDIDEWHPRPEFDVHDNPILAAYRRQPDFDLWDMGFAMFTTFGGERTWDRPEHHFHAFVTATGEQIEHARRVLTKLGALHEAAHV